MALTRLLARSLWEKSFRSIGDGTRAGEATDLLAYQLHYNGINLQLEERGRTSAWYMCLYMWSLILQQAFPEKVCRVLGTKYSRVGGGACGGLVRRAPSHTMAYPTCR